MDKPDDILILGCCYTPEFNENYDGPFLKYNEINKNLVNQIKDKDVFVEHQIYDNKTNKKLKVGKVVDAYINSKGQVMSFLHITGDPFASKQIKHGLATDENGKRFFNDLSLGHGVVFDIDQNTDKINIEKKLPEEVSLVKKGDRPDTKIYDYWLYPNNTDPNKIKKSIPELIM